MIRPPARVERWIKATWFRGLREPAGLRVGLEAELARKVAQARANGRVPEGFLLDARRAS